MLRVAPIREPSEVVGNWELYNEITEEGRKSKKIFYFNRKTFETSYDKPKEIEEAENLQKKTANFSYNNFSGYQDESGNWTSYNDSYYNNNQYDGGYYDDQGYYYDNSNYNNADVMTSKGGHSGHNHNNGAGAGAGGAASTSSRFPPISSRPSARNGGYGPAHGLPPPAMSSRSQKGMMMTNTATGEGGSAQPQLPKLSYNAAVTPMSTIPGDDSAAMMMTTNGGNKSKKPALSKRGLPYK